MHTSLRYFCHLNNSKLNIGRSTAGKYLDVPQLSNLNTIIKVVGVNCNQHLCTLYAY